MLYWQTDILWYSNILQISGVLALSVCFRQWFTDRKCWIESTISITKEDSSHYKWMALAYVPIFSSLQLDTRLDDVYNFYLGRFVFQQFNRLLPEPPRVNHVSGEAVHQYNTRHKCYMYRRDLPHWHPIVWFTKISKILILISWIPFLHLLEMLTPLVCLLVYWRGTYMYLVKGATYIESISACSL